VVAYRALTGHLPFAGDTIGALAITVSTGKFTPPSHLRPELPPAVDAWMTRALQRDPDARLRGAQR
jgi:serine/threonine-protein kinase